MSDSEELAPMTQHVLDMVPPEIQQLFRDILKYRVDPDGEYYGITIEHLTTALSDLRQPNAVAIGSNPEDFKYLEKGHMYDPILQSFIQGSGGQISNWEKQSTSMIPAVLRGITKRKEMAACQAAGRDFFYIDTGYFGNGKKKTYHRITRNDVQNFGPIINRPRDRWAKTGIQLKKFRSGTNILLTPPSQKLLNLYNIDLETWLSETQEKIKSYTDRPII